MSVESILIAILICFSPRVSMKIYDGLSFGAYCVRKPSKCPSGTSIVCNIGSKQYQEVCTSISPHDKAYSSKELKNLVVKINRKPITPDTNLSLLRSLDKTLKEATEVKEVRNKHQHHPNDIKQVAVKNPKQFLRKYYKSLYNKELKKYAPVGERENEIVLKEVEAPEYMSPLNSPAQPIDWHFDDLKNYQKIKSQIDGTEMYLPIVQF